MICIKHVMSTSKDVSWDFVLPAIYTEVELHLCIISATIPCIHVFLKHFNTGLLMITTSQAASRGSNIGSDSYHLSVLRERRKPMIKRWEGRGRTGGNFYVDDSTAYRTTAIANAGDPDHVTDFSSVRSDASDAIMVSRTVEVRWCNDP